MCGSAKEDGLLRSVRRSTGETVTWKVNLSRGRVSRTVRARQGELMPFVELAESPHAPGIRPIRIHYRKFGLGRPLVFLHGGWGYGVYPFERQIEAFKSQFRILIPDRTGYGSSTRVAGEMPMDFHQRAAQETLAFLDALGIERAAF